jgi:hypothetical protein
LQHRQFHFCGRFQQQRYVPLPCELHQTLQRSWSWSVLRPSADELAFVDRICRMLPSTWVSSISCSSAADSCAA